MTSYERAAVILLARPDVDQIDYINDYQLYMGINYTTEIKSYIFLLGTGELLISNYNISFRGEKIKTYSGYLLLFGAIFLYCFSLCKEWIFSHLCLYEIDFFPM